MAIAMGMGAEVSLGAPARGAIQNSPFAGADAAPGAGLLEETSVTFPRLAAVGQRTSPLRGLKWPESPG